MLKGVFTAVLALVIAIPAPAQDAGLRGRVEAALAQAAAGTRFGLLVVDDQGREVIAINPDQRFIPASNTKMFTTAAAYATLPDMTGPDTTGGAAVRLEGRDVVLVGNGDARLSSADDCAVDCLATLADAVAARTHVVGTITGDDTLFPDERWSPGMSLNNIPTRSGTGISALTLDDNELVVMVAPDGKVSLPAYYTVENRVTVVPGTKSDIGFDRAP
ncbi:MAG: penicillin-binding protein, partial [Sphingomonas bacterium]|nr:penicillin-binding protein [Sphingomonas bacterium]